MPRSLHHEGHGMSKFIMNMEIVKGHNHDDSKAVIFIDCRTGVLTLSGWFFNIWGTGLRIFIHSNCHPSQVTM